MFKLTNLPRLHRHGHGDGPGHHHHHDHAHSRQARGEQGHAGEQAKSEPDPSRVVTIGEQELGLRREPLPRGAGRGMTLYFDAFAGAGGDMCVAALVDLGVPLHVVTDAVGTLGLGIDLGISLKTAGSISALKLHVTARTPQPERSYAEIKELLAGASLEPRARELALLVFERLARAEAKIHGVQLNEVHFHEVGAYDSIADIVGIGAALAYLGARVECSPLPMGRGFIECRHGRIPLPAPATLECLAGLITVDAGIEGELVTPTAAAFLGAIASSTRWPALRPRRTGWGAGQRTWPDRPNALRVVMGEPVEHSAAQTSLSYSHAVVETNLDDATGELIGHALGVLLGAGALDAWATPCTMKKGRPGLTLSALCVEAQSGAMADVLLRETSAIGVRVSPVLRQELPRTLRLVQTPFGEIPVKVSADLGSGLSHAKPEFDVCKQLAERHGVSVREVLTAALNAVLPNPVSSESVSSESVLPHSVLPKSKP
ncbi:MAG TPA: nickel pincer cofactor biosynthesis protein LarC [Polyangiaceae bacterium]|nr:nickel pincer cofactor biosynthesis protein LarC [Polyangiaceae bacterium]